MQVRSNCIIKDYTHNNLKVRIPSTSVDSSKKEKEENLFFTQMLHLETFFWVSCIIKILFFHSFLSALDLKPHQISIRTNVLVVLIKSWNLSFRDFFGFAYSDLMDWSWIIFFLKMDIKTFKGLTSKKHFYKMGLKFSLVISISKKSH